MFKMELPTPISLETSKGVDTRSYMAEELRKTSGFAGDTAPVSPEFLHGAYYTLPKGVSAIQILPTEDGERTRLGLITQLPEGAEIEIGGPGFSDRTVSVRCSGASYFVFLDDLEPVKLHAAAAHA